MKARKPLAKSCVTPCRTIATCTGSAAAYTPIRIIPPAMPKTPEITDVANAVTVASAGEAVQWKPSDSGKYRVAHWKEKREYFASI